MQPERSCMFLLLGDEEDSLVVMMTVAIETDVADDLAGVVT